MRPVNVAPAAATIWGSWVLLLIVLGILDLQGQELETAALFAVGLHTAVTLSAILVLRISRWLSLVLIAAYLVRLVLLVWDTYSRSSFPIPGTGSDTEGFYRAAVTISEGSTSLPTTVHGGTFTQAVGLLFTLVGDARLVAQYTNVLLALTTIIIILCILSEMEIGNRAATVAIAVFALAPYPLTLSTLLLREQAIAFVLALSLWTMLRWVMTGNYFYGGIAFALVLAAGSLHSGVIVILIAYAIALSTYDPASAQWTINKRSAIKLVVFAAAGILALRMAPDTFLSYFERGDDAERLLDTVNARAGDSSYLNELRVVTTQELITSAPIRAAYFLYSPLPWDWRGVADVLTFVLDSVLYLGVAMLYLRSHSASPKHRLFGILAAASILLAALAYGVGVANSGTAMRHRAKLFPFFAILLAAALQSRWRVLPRAIPTGRDEIQFEGVKPI